MHNMPDMLAFLVLIGSLFQLTYRQEQSVLSRLIAEDLSFRLVRACWIIATNIWVNAGFSCFYRQEQIFHLSRLRPPQQEISLERLHST